MKNKIEIEKELKEQFVEFLKGQNNPNITVYNRVYKNISYDDMVWDSSSNDSIGAHIIPCPFYYYKNKVNQLGAFWEKDLFNYLLKVSVKLGKPIHFDGISLFKTFNGQGENDYDCQEMLLVSAIY